MSFQLNHSTVTGGEFNNIAGDYTKTVYNYAEDPVEKFKRWLVVPDPSVNHNNTRKKCHGSSGWWLLKDARYITWKESPNSLMWINGISGCGKTIICSTVIQDLMDMQPEPYLAYFYFDTNDLGKIMPEGLLSSLVLNVTAKLERFAVLEALYKKHNKVHKPTHAELLVVLRELLGACGPFYIVMDALDECAVYDDLEKVILDITNWKLPHCHMLVSSRREQYILNSLRGCTPIELLLSADLVDQDITQYVHDKVEKEGKNKRWDRQLQEQIEEKLLNGANGMFCWVACQIEELTTCRSIHAVWHALHNLPNSLESIYDLNLKRIQKRDAPTAMLLLHWLVLGMHPLAIHELAILAQFDASIMAYDAALGLTNYEDVLSICSSLVIWNSDDTVSLAHASVKEYFLQSPRHIGFVQVNIHHMELGHKLITKCCLTYLLQLDEEDLEEHTFDDFPLSRYSSEFWYEHYARSKDHSLQHMLIPLFHPDREHLFKWAKCAQSMERGFKGDSTSPIYYASLLGFEWVVGGLRKVVDLDIKGGFFGSPVQAASANGHLEIIKLLLGSGADVNADGGHYGSAIQAASADGHLEIVKVLLISGADVNAGGGHYGSAVQAASANGHIEIVKVLLANGANVNASGGYYGSAVQAASANSHIEIIKMLLDNGAHVNVLGGYPSALQAASRNGDIEMVKILLASGAEVTDTVDREYGNALQVASANGYFDVVKTLLAAGANVNVVGIRYDTALQAASRNGYLEIVLYLLEMGAKISQDELEPTSLQFSSVQGHLHRYHDALQAASAGGHLDIIKVILARKGNTKHHRKFAGYALQVASLEGHLYLCYGDLHAVTISGHVEIYGGTLHVASVKGHTAVVQNLLANGMKLDEDGAGHTALQATSISGHATICSGVLHAGKIYGHLIVYGSALQAASVMQPPTQALLRG